MLEERVIVVRVEAAQAWVTALGPDQCRRCRDGGGCGGGFFARIVRRRRSEIAADHSLRDLRVGEQVVVGFAEDALLKASLVVYLLPLAGLFVAGGFAHRVMQAGDLLVAGFAVCGLLAGLGGARAVADRLQHQADFRLRILRRCRPDADHCARLPLAALHDER